MSRNGILSLRMISWLIFLVTLLMMQTHVSTLNSRFTNTTISVFSIQSIFPAYVPSRSKFVRPAQHDPIV